MSVVQPSALRSNELYERILLDYQIPSMDTSGAQNPVEVHVLGNQEIGISQTEIKLPDHELFILNALLLVRPDGMVGAPVLREPAPDQLFRPDSSRQVRSSKFSVDINKLLERVNTAASTELIMQEGAKQQKRYGLALDFELKNSDRDIDPVNELNIPGQAELKTILIDERLDEILRLSKEMGVHIPEAEALARLRTFRDLSHYPDSLNAMAGNTAKWLNALQSRAHKTQAIS